MASAPNLPDYLDRIGYAGPTEPSLDVLRAIHRAHAVSIAYENLDVMLEVPVSTEIGPIFDKIVGRGRGGWCYEMNGLLGWALAELGFDVVRLTGGVFREFVGDEAFGNHVVLRVDLDEPWIADVGIGDCFLEPLPLRAGTHERLRGDARYQLETLGGNEWRVRNREGAGPPRFDFIDAPADEDRLEQVSRSLQRDPTSMFRTRLTCLRMTDTAGSALIDRTVVDMVSGQEESLESAAALKKTITSIVGTAPSEIDRLWELTGLSS